MVYRNLALIALLTAAVALPVWAGGSIFSGNAIGEQVVGGGARAQGFGGGGLGLRDSMGYNSDNPALAAFSMRTLIRMSGQMGIWDTKSKGQSVSDAEFLWKDFFVYFPVAPRWKIGLGAVPQTHMDLRTFVGRTAIFQSQGQTPAHADTVGYVEDGVWQGGRVDLHLDNSVRLSDQLAVGLSAAYIMLRDERDRTVNLPRLYSSDHSVDSMYYADVTYAEIETFRGWQLGLGGYYSPLPRLGLGLVYRPQMNGHWDYALSKAGGGPSSSRNRSGRSPGEVDIGASYQFAERFVAVGDIRSGQWQAGDLGIIADSAGTIKPVNPLFLSAGIERLAGHAPLQTGFETWGYRAGVYYRKHYWPLENVGDSQNRNGVPVEDYGVTGGVSIPVADHTGWLHIAAEGGQRGRDETKLGAKETFFRASVQLEMSETWFQRTRPRIPK